MWLSGRLRRQLRRRLTVTVATGITVAMGTMAATGITVAMGTMVDTAITAAMGTMADTGTPPVTATTVATVTTAGMATGVAIAGVMCQSISGTNGVSLSARRDGAAGREVGGAFFVLGHRFK